MDDTGHVSNLGSSHDLKRLYLPAKSAAPLFKMDEIALNENARHKSKRTWPVKCFSKWSLRSGIQIAFWGCLAVFSANLVILITAATLNEGFQGGVGVLSNGNSMDMSSLTTTLHILINVLSTGLLTASNYCMQMLCAPTREDVDRAHMRGQYMDIGVLSLRNLRRIPRRRAVLWVLLALSSLPLHLL